MAKKDRKRRKRPPRPRRTRHSSYSWALHVHLGDPELREVSAEARSGLHYATLLALAARERSRMALDGLMSEPLTVERLAEEDWTNPITIRSQIKQARIEIFGRNLSDSAIAYRLKKQRERGTRVCAEPDCRRPIPSLANGRRRYCDFHGTGAARLRRHRHGVAGFKPIRPRRSRRVAD